MLGVLGACVLAVPAPVRADGVPRGRVVAGVLSGPSAATPSRVALGFLAAQPSLLGGAPVESLRPRLRPVHDGWLVSLQQHHRGLPVVGATATVRIDALGRVRWARSSTVALGELPTAPRLRAPEAASRVLGARGRGDAGPLDPRRARLVVWAIGAPRLAWQVQLPMDLPRRESLRGIVDARTGAVLQIENRVAYADEHRAYVHDPNPDVSPEAVEVTLADLPPGATGLRGPEIDTVACVDRRTCGYRTSGADGASQSHHWCETEPTAAANATGDFLDIGRPASDTDPTDAFAEIQIHFHANRAIGAFRQWSGDPDFALATRPLTAIANFRLPPAAVCEGDAAPEGSSLLPLDNAFYATEGELDGNIEQDVLAFGQGTSVDFSYDGDIVYHEMGHAVMFGLTPLTVVPFRDRHGVDPTPGAIHEGTADYFSSAITGDPEVGEYAGAVWGDFLPIDPDEELSVRSLRSDKTCPRDLAGESHQDSAPWSAALWEIREATAPEQRSTLDSAVLTAILGLGQFDGFATAHALVVAEIEAVLGAEAAEAARASFERRGIADGCANRVRSVELGGLEKVLLLWGTDYLPGAAVPAPVQQRLELPRRAEAIVMTGIMFGEAIRLLVKPGADAIEWSWEGPDGMHDASHEVEVDAIASPFTVEIPGPFEAGPVHVQLVNGGPTTAGYDLQLSARLAPVDPGADAEPPAPDADASGGHADLDAGPDAARPPSEGGEGSGCGCRMARPGGSGGTGLAIALLLAIALVRAIALLLAAALRRRR